MSAISEWRDRRRWLRGRTERQLASEAEFYLDHPEPVVLGHWRTVVAHSNPPPVPVPADELEDWSAAIGVDVDELVDWSIDVDLDDPDTEIVLAYCSALVCGDPVDPILIERVCSGGWPWWVHDGCHRITAHLIVGIAYVPALIAVTE